MPTKTGQNKPPPMREALSCNRSIAKPPAAPIKKYPARNVFSRRSGSRVPVGAEGGGKPRAHTSQPRTKPLFHRYFPGRPGSQGYQARKRGFDHSLVEAVEPPESEQEEAT